MSGLRVGSVVGLLVASAAPAAGQYFQWYAPTDTSGVQWASQTSWQASTALAADRLTVRAALAAALGCEVAEWGGLSTRPGEAYAWARGCGASLLRSEDGGYTWTRVWTAPGYPFYGNASANRIDALLFGPAGELWIGASYGLFLDDDPVPLPPKAQKVIGLALDPRDPHTLWVATDYLAMADGGRVSGIGLFRRREEGDSVRWEDVGVGLPGPVMTIGFDPARPDMVYLRQRRHNVLAARMPEAMTPEVVGWSRVPAAPVVQTLQPQPLAEALRVRSSYPGPLLEAPVDWYELVGVGGYPLALAGLVYAGSSSWLHGRSTYSLHQSRDGGVSWRQVASYSTDGFPGDVLLWDNRERVVLSAGGLPGVAGSSLHEPVRHLLDASTLYYSQVGRGHLFRSYDLTTWEELSAGLDPMLTASAVVVDSLSRVYLETDQGIFMRQDVVRPCRIRSLEVRPDTARIGVDTQVTLVARIEAADPACDGPQVTAVFQEEEHEAPRQPDGSYLLSLPLGDAPAPGFYGVTVFAAPAAWPQARVSELRPVMVAPANVVPILSDSVDGAWQMELVGGTLEPVAASAPGGTVARRLDGQVAFHRVGGEPVHPFGYRLELLAAAADSVSLRALQINGADLETLGARWEAMRESPGWTRILVPAEQLLVEPRAELQGGVGEYWYVYYPAFVDEILIAAPGEVVLGGMRLVPVGLEAGEPTAVVEAAASTPLTCRLGPVFPNPFNAAVTIPYTLPASGQVELVLYDAAGQRIRSLGAPWQAAGEHAVVWDGRDDAGRAVSSGAYFCRLHASGTVVRKLLLVR